MSVSEKGQTLVEVLIALTVGIIVIGALAITTIVSLRNSQFSQNQLQATQLAQEGIDLVRSNRDKDTPIIGTVNGASNLHFSSFWNMTFGKSTDAGYFGCFKLSSTQLSAANTCEKEDIQSLFKRQVLIEDDTSTTKKITVKVLWSDHSGSHESNLQTILGKL